MPRVLHVSRSGDVSLDGESLGYIARNDARLYEGVASDGRVVTSNADCKSTAAHILARRVGALQVGDLFRITGIPSATGGPWTVGA